MSVSQEHIYPIFQDFLSRNDKETYLNQNAKALWFTGLSGSGKSTVAKGLEKKLFEKRIFVQVLDGDNVRTGINNNLGFSEEDRTENIRRIAEVSKLFLNCGIVTINCFVSPTIEMREHARNIIGSGDFLEVFINAPLEVCETRDVKGLYAKARSGEISNFTGIDAPFEPPLNPDIEVRTDLMNEEESVEKILSEIIPIIQK